MQDTFSQIPNKRDYTSVMHTGVVSYLVTKTTLRYPLNEQEVLSEQVDKNLKNS